jgi:hypothetical protein
MRYASLVIAGTLGIAAAAVACLEPEPAATSTDTPTLAAATAIPCVGGAAQDVPYFEKRVFLESQGWWGERKADGVNVPTYGDAEHIHVGMCFPVKQTVSGTALKVVVKVMGHNLPVGSRIVSTGLHDPNDNVTHISLASKSWNRTVLASDNGDIVLWDTLTIDTKRMPDGLREFRNLTTVVRPPEPGKTVGAELHASSGWCWQVKNTTNAPKDSGTCANTSGAFTTMGRGWYDCFEYKIAEVRNWSGTSTLTAYPFGGISPNQPYSIKISGRDGAGDNLLVSKWEVRWDPNFHMDTLGTLIASGTFPVTNQTVTIQAGLITSRVVPHKLVIITHANEKCTTPATPGSGIVPQDGEVSGVMAFPVKVN